MTYADCKAYLVEHCNPPPHKWPDETDRYAEILWMLTECIAAKHVLEIGVGPTSVSGMVFAHSMSNRGGGQLVSFDIDPARPRVEYMEHAGALGVKWDVFHGDSLSTVDMFASMFDPFDLVYVDGAHDCEHAYWDTKNAVKYLKRGGYLVIDDSSDLGVCDARQLLEADGFTFVHLAHRPPHGNGRLVWQKP
jgi:predicted O-methyltransferase YrrM